MPDNIIWYDDIVCSHRDLWRLKKLYEWLCNDPDAQ